MRYPLEVPALRVHQPFGDFFVVALSVAALEEVAFSDVAKAVPTEASYIPSGTQRPIRASRLREIALFIDSVEATFPTSIILAANYRPDGRIESRSARRWRIHQDAEGLRLVVPTAERLASIVDGQHRLKAFSYANNPERRSMELICSVFFDLPNPYQAYLFATVNFNQTKVDRSLAYELFGFDVEAEPPHAWSPEKLAVFLCRRINTDSKSPLYRRIIVAPQDDELWADARAPGDWAVSTAAVVDGTLRLFSSKPRADRAVLHRVELSQRNRASLLDDKTPLRALFRQTNDKALYALLFNYFVAVEAHLWRDSPSRSSLRKTVGVQALFDVLRSTLASDALGTKDISPTFFGKRLLAASRVDFTDEFFQASGKGRVRIKNTLLLRMNYKSLDQVPSPDRKEYERVTDV